MLNGNSGSKKFRLISIHRWDGHWRKQWSKKSRYELDGIMLIILIGCLELTHAFKNMRIPRDLACQVVLEIGQTNGLGLSDGELVDWILFNFLLHLLMLLVLQSIKVNGHACFATFNLLRRPKKYKPRLSNTKKKLTRLACGRHIATCLLASGEYPSPFGRSRLSSRESASSWDLAAR